MAIKYQRYGSTFDFSFTGLHASALLAVTFLAGVAVGCVLFL
ncbi:MAG TPA: hypothetical protein VN150_12300 [Ochrobactrum sp.]|nr:hypothetical protein [Ochrobactrum sp.]